MDDMTDDALIEYCHAHCQTPRALFHESHINRLLELAGSHRKAAMEWCSFGPPVIFPFVRKARINQEEKKIAEEKEKQKKAPWQEVGF